MTLTLRPVAGVDHPPPAGPLDAIPWILDPLEPGAYDVIVADPPWQFEHWSARGVTTKSAGSHYKLMGIEAIKALPVRDLANPAGAICLLWTSAPMLPDGIETLRAWGFAYNSRIIWRKVYRSGAVKMTTGYRVRCCDEAVLVGMVGKVPRPKRTIRSIFDGVARNRLPGEAKAQHSRKPAEFWPHVDGIHPGARRWCELFAREAHALPSGAPVDPWGDEIEFFATLGTDHGGV